MQHTIFIMLIFAFTTQLSAQTFKIHPPSVQPDRPSYKKPKLSRDIFDTTSLRRLNSQNHIAKLKQDNMPCIIPVPLKPEIPNGYYYERIYPGKIPNAWNKTDTTRKTK